MIQLTQPLRLRAADTATLHALQQQVDAASDYPARVALANSKWDHKRKDLFERVRRTLAASCPGAQRCNYCEDSLADEIEHIRPKSWFPEQTFVPDNYLFACGPCNSPKGNAYAAISAAGQLTEAVRPRGGPVLPPPAGQEALLHPRFDNALDYLALDLAGTFHFRPRLGLSLADWLRADYTIRVLRLNERDPLPQAREGRGVQGFRRSAIPLSSIPAGRRDGRRAAPAAARAAA